MSFYSNALAFEKMFEKVMSDLQSQLCLFHHWLVIFLMLWETFFFSPYILGERKLTFSLAKSTIWNHFIVIQPDESFVSAVVLTLILIIEQQE